jgi:DivIVA domain-containing protein
MASERDVGRTGDGASSGSIAAHEFNQVRRGYDQTEVRRFLAEVGDEMERLRARSDELSSRLAHAEQQAADQAAHPVVSEEALVAAVGAEMATALRTAHGAANDLRTRATEEAQRVVAEAVARAAAVNAEADERLAAIHAETESRLAAAATEAESRVARAVDEAERIMEAARQTATAEGAQMLAKSRADAESIRQQAEQERRLTVEGAQSIRERILADLARRRRVATVQIEQLRAGRERLLESYGVVRRTLEEVHDELQRADAEARAAADEAGKRLEGEPTETIPVVPAVEPRLTTEDPVLTADPVLSTADPVLPIPDVGGEPGPPGAVDLAADTVLTTADPVLPAAESAGEPGPLVPADAEAAVESPAGPEHPVEDDSAEGDRPGGTAPGATASGLTPPDATPALPTSPPTIPSPSTAPAGEPGDSGAVTPLSAVEDGRGGDDTAGRAAPTAPVTDPPAPASVVSTGNSTANSAAPTASVRPNPVRFQRAVTPTPAAAPIVPTAGGRPSPGGATGGLRVLPGGGAAAALEDAEPEIEPEHEPEIEPEPEMASEPEIEPEQATVSRADPSTHSGPGLQLVESEEGGPEAGEEDPERPDSVGTLFQRIRADRERSVGYARRVLGESPVVSATDDALSVPEVGPMVASVAPAAGADPVATDVSEGGGTTGTDTVDAGVVRSDADEMQLQRRDAQLEELLSGLTRRLKRALQDEHNDLLDRLRARRGASDLEDVLGEPGAQAERYQVAARPFVTEAASAGVEFANETSPVADDAAAETVAVVSEPAVVTLAAAITAPLRARVGALLAERADQADDGLVDVLASVYREVRSHRLEPLVIDTLTAVHAEAAWRAAPDDALLQWVVEDAGGPCADCDDNVLAGPVRKGEAFPTGQLHPPAHVGCRCLLVRQGE